MRNHGARRADEAGTGGRRRSRRRAGMPHPQDGWPAGSPAQAKVVAGPQAGDHPRLPVELLS